MSWRFHTQEIPPAEKARAMEYYLQFGELLFAPEGRELSVADLTASEVYIKGDVKSASQRLRFKIKLWWEQEGSKGDSEVFYQAKMKQLEAWVDKKLI